VAERRGLHWQGERRVAWRNLSPALSCSSPCCNERNYRWPSGRGVCSAARRRRAKRRNCPAAASTPWRSSSLAARSRPAWPSRCRDDGRPHGLRRLESRDREGRHLWSSHHWRDASATSHASAAPHAGAPCYARGTPLERGAQLDHPNQKIVGVGHGQSARRPGWPGLAQAGCRRHKKPGVGDEQESENAPPGGVLAGRFLSLCDPAMKLRHPLEFQDFGGPPPTADCPLRQSVSGT
jgi:hypothetical protein